MEAEISICYVGSPLGDPGRVAGYYTLSASSISRGDLPDDVTRRLPLYPDLPAVLLGRLARDLSFKGRGLGEQLLLDALRHVLKVSNDIGIMALATMPIDERAEFFYAQFGFEWSTGELMYLPVKTIERLNNQVGLF